MLARAIVPPRRSGLRGLGQAVNCSDFFTWPPNIFNPDCYSITWAKMFGSPTDKAAAYAATSPDVAYPPQPAPIPPAAVTNYGMSPTAVTPVDQAQAAVDAAIADAKARSNAQNISYFSQVAGNLDQLAAQSPTSSGINWWLVGGGVVLGVILFKKVF